MTRRRISIVALFLAALAPGASRADMFAAPRAPSEDGAVVLARGGFRMGPAVGYRGGAYGYRGGGYYGAWRRPYAWPPGGAIAAGAAIGVLSAEAAAGYATVAAPADGLCWYYTDDTGAQGFWDVCQ